MGEFSLSSKSNVVLPSERQIDRQIDRRIDRQTDRQR